MTATSSLQSASPVRGDRAPDFALPSSSGQSISLAQFRGQPVLIAFFPLAFSPTCTTELCEMRDDWDEFASRGVAVLPISVDSTYALKEYQQKYGLKVDLLSDFKREVTRLYGVLNEERFFANRAYFLVDPTGIVRWAHVETSPSHKRSNAEILSEVDRLK